jgi:hypothetical protein
VTKPNEDGIAELFRRAIERKNRAIGTQRIGDLNKLFARRYGNRESYVFPNDDAGVEDLKILLHHYALNNPLAMPRIIKLRAPWVNEAAAARLLEQIEAFPQKWRADTLGRKLNLAGVEWRTLRLRTVAPVDMTQQERVAFSQALARQRRQARRRAHGKKPRAEYLAKSLSQTKPWLAVNISRSTWYRRGKPTPRTSGTSVDTIKILKATTRPVPPSTGMGGEDGWPSGTAASRTAEARSLQFRVKLELEHPACVNRLVPEAGRSISETHIRTGEEKLASEELFEQKETNPARSQDRD